ncbi:MAG: trypsin-like peptidase domain-containing protein [Bacilli bacterium]
MKKILIIVLFLFILSGCNITELDMVKPNIIYLNIGDTYNLNSDDYISSNDEIMIVEEKKATAIGVGYVTLKNEFRTFEFIIKSEVKDITVNAFNNLKLGEEKEIEVSIIPSVLSQEYIITTNDPSILEINDNTIKGISTGLATVNVISKLDESVSKSFVVLVTDTYTSDEDDFLQEIKNELIKLDTTTNYFQGIIEPAISSTVIVNNYINNEADSYGTGFIYKRNLIGDNLYEYHIITNRHVVIDADLLTVESPVYNEEIELELLAYDSKVDVAVLKFTSEFYFPTVKFGNSDDVKTGEFVMAIGNPNNYLNSTNLGIVSFPTRYLSDDTDGDNISDWDSNYIQHDASINQGNSGGPLLNLKGEVIGVNTLKISSITVEDMGFAIPINIVIDLLEFLEAGITPDRPVLGISVIDIKSINESRSYYDTYVPEVDVSKVTSNITYGFYVTEVTAGGLGHAAGMQKDDILLEFNNVLMRYSYILRAEIGKFVIGSGEVVEIKVHRNGEDITLQVTY